jgi:hypothetical protein
MKVERRKFGGTAGKFNNVLEVLVNHCVLEPNKRKATNMVAKGTEILSSTTSVTGIHSTTVAANATRASLPNASSQLT